MGARTRRHGTHGAVQRVPAAQRAKDVPLLQHLHAGGDTRRAAAASTVTRHAERRAAGLRAHVDEVCCPRVRFTAPTPLRRAQCFLSRGLFCPVWSHNRSISDPFRLTLCEDGC